MIIRVCSSWTFGMIGQDQRKAKLFGRPLDVEFADGESASRGTVKNAEETEGLGGLAHADPADAELCGHFVLGRQTVARLQLVGDDEMFDATGDDFAEILSLDRFHVVSRE